MSLMRRPRMSPRWRPLYPLSGGLHHLLFYGMDGDEVLDRLGRVLSAFITITFGAFMAGAWFDLGCAFAMNALQRLGWG